MPIRAQIRGAHQRGSLIWEIPPPFRTSLCNAERSGAMMLGRQSFRDSIFFPKGLGIVSFLQRCRVCWSYLGLVHKLDCTASLSLGIHFQFFKCVVCCIFTRLSLVTRLLGCFAHFNITSNASVDILQNGWPEICCGTVSNK